MSTTITFWGAAGFEITWPGRRLLVDPFLTGNPAAPLAPDTVETPDVILVSHAAFDHVGDTATIAKRTGAPIICGGDVRILLMDQGVDGDQIQATVWGIVTEVAGVVVRPVECHHWSHVSAEQRGDAERNAARVRRRDGAGRPDLPLRRHRDLRHATHRRALPADVGLLGCTNPQELLDAVPGPGRFLTGEMSPDEAARAAEMLGVELAVACHYLAKNPDVDEFLELVPKHDSTGRRKALAPRVGESIVVEDGDYRIEGSP